VGDGAASPLREVQTTATTEPEVSTNKPISHGVMVEKVEDKDKLEHKTGGAEEKRAEEAAEWLQQHQREDENDQKHQRKLAKERVRKAWRRWKGTSQQHYQRWKTRRTNISRFK